MKILFQGDSITDAGRDRSDYHELGKGYPFYAAKYIREDNPDADFEFINLGISGNQTIDLVNRVQSDFVDIKPDVVSILIGINDNHRTPPDGMTNADWYESCYRRILDRSFENNPDLKLIIMEPFTEPKPYQHNTAQNVIRPAETQSEYESRRERLGTIQNAARRIAADYNAVFVELQSVFDNLINEKIPSTYWLWDGIHVTEAGSWIIANEWLKSSASIL